MPFCFLTEQVSLDCFGVENKMALFLCLLFLVISSATADDCDQCLHQSKVSYFPDESAINGACGYGSLAASYNYGYIAATNPGIYKDGVGCGACFQIRCKNSSLCTKNGAAVVVTDLQQSNQTDFVVSSRALMAMAQKGKGEALKALGLVNVEYKRVPCNYPNKNFSIRIEESSQKPNYLAITFLYQGGQTDILVAEVGQMGSPSWYSVRRNHGAVWDAKQVPSGALLLRFAVIGGYDAKWYTIKIPADWSNGKIYDTALNIADIAQDGCSQCLDATLK